MLRIAVRLQTKLCTAAARRKTAAIFSAASISSTSKSVLLIGIEPKLLDYSKPPFSTMGLTEEKVVAGLAKDSEALLKQGFEMNICYTDYGETAEARVTDALKERRFDAVLIGAGIRTAPECFLLFEKLINVVHNKAPHAKICFNTKPNDTLEAVNRCFQSS